MEKDSVKSPLSRHQKAIAGNDQKDE